jgi:hypothetical protein
MNEQTMNEQTMNEQTGGLKLINIEKRGFTPVYDMAVKDSSIVSLLTASSLKGFMFNLIVDESNSEYLTLNGTQFTSVVTKFILKFVVITGRPNFYLGDYNGVRKSSESINTFFEEAKLQQHIWKKSITGGGPAICPSVANLSMFNWINSARLLSFFFHKTNAIPDTSEAFDFIFNNSNKESRGIGVLVMPTITQSTTLGRFFDLPDNSDFYGKEITDAEKSEAVSNVFAQIVRLFIEIGVIHFDLHLGNALIYLTPELEIKSSLIDFGKASDILSDATDNFIPKDFKETRARVEMKKFYDEFLSLIRDGNNSNEKKTAYIRQVLDFVARTDLTVNNPRYYKNDGKNYQMRWFTRFVNYIPLMARAFDILQTMIPANVDSTETHPIDSMETQPETLKSYETGGYLVNFDSAEGLSSFIVPYPGPATINTDPAANGGRRNKKSKRKKGRSKRQKNKKNKNTRKNR